MREKAGVRIGKNVADGDDEIAGEEMNTYCDTYEIPCRHPTCSRRCQTCRRRKTLRRDRKRVSECNQRPRLKGRKLTAREWGKEDYLLPCITDTFETSHLLTSLLNW